VYRIRDVARETLANFIMAVPTLRTWRVRTGRTADKDIVSQAQQLRGEFQFFLGTIGRGALAGSTVVEIGPGDTIALAPLFLQAGASRYIAYDRFPGDVYNPYALELYSRLTGLSRIDLKSLMAERARVRPISMEDADPQQEEKADFVVSFNVIEHLADPILALEKMAAILRHDGLMIHRVDYGPHDVWRSYRNQLAFLTVNPSLWRLMGSNRGYPNRVRHRELISSLRSLGLHVDDRITQRFGIQDLREVRDLLQTRFARFDDEDMLVQAAEFACSRSRSVSLGAPFSMQSDSELAETI
jgi:SAM-dependent methyltransferase